MARLVISALALLMLTACEPSEQEVDAFREKAYEVGWYCHKVGKTVNECKADFRRIRGH